MTGPRAAGAPAILKLAADRDLSPRRIWGVFRAQLPLVMVVTVPSLFLVLAEVGVLSTSAAIDASLFFGMFLLFCVSFLLGVHHRGAYEPRSSTVSWERAWVLWS